MRQYSQTFKAPKDGRRGTYPKPRAEELSQKGRIKGYHHGVRGSQWHKGGGWMARSAMQMLAKNMLSTINSRVEARQFLHCGILTE